MTKKKSILSLFIFALLFSLSSPIQADTSLITTDRGIMRAFVGGGYLPQTQEKLVEYTSTMTNGVTTRLYLKSTTVGNLSGNTIHSVPRFGGSGRSTIHDYFYLKGYASTVLVTFTTHEAIWTNAHSTMLTFKN